MIIILERLGEGLLRLKYETFVVEGVVGKIK